MIDINFLSGTPNFIDFIEQYKYLGILIWFLIFDQLTPVPGEISLLIIGFLCGEGVFHNILLAIGVSAAAFLLIDCVYYYLTLKSHRFVNRIIKKTSSFSDRYKDKMEKHFGKTLLILIFIPRLRILGPILAAALKVNFRKFFFYDAASLLLFSTIFISLGAIYHNGISRIFDQVEYIGHLVFGVLVITIAIIAIYFRMNRKKSTSFLPKIFNKI